jgi:hypothetical protein
MVGQARVRRGHQPYLVVVIRVFHEQRVVVQIGQGFSKLFILLMTMFPKSVYQLDWGSQGGTTNVS